MKITKKSITLLLAGLLCASNSFSQTYPKQDGVIRLLTYNTHYCKGGTDPGSLNDLNTKRFANILKALDADVVALQELDSAANGRWKRVLMNEKSSKSVLINIRPTSLLNFIFFIFLIGNQRFTSVPLPTLPPS